MEKIKVLMEQLNAKDAKIAYEALKELVAQSEKSNEVYLLFDTFAIMLEDNNSYVRNRGLALIAANARWDTENKIDEIIDQYLEHILDVKPITSRQCIKGLLSIAEYKPDLVEDILEALTKADLSQYADSMRPLIAKDIVAVVGKINNLKKDTI